MWLLQRVRYRAPSASRANKRNSNLKRNAIWIAAYKSTALNHALRRGCELPAKTGQRVAHGRTGNPDRAIERAVQFEQEKDRPGNRQRANQQGGEDRRVARRE